MHCLRPFNLSHSSLTVQQKRDLGGRASDEGCEDGNLDITDIVVSWVHPRTALPGTGPIIRDHEYKSMMIYMQPSMIAP